MRFGRRLSIRVRLTVGTLVIAGVFFAGTAVVVHRQVDSILRSSSVMLLEGDLAQYQQEIADGRSSDLDTPAQGQLVAVVDPRGKVMQSSLPAELEPQLTALAAAGPAVQDVRTPAARYLVLARQVTTADGVWGVVTARNEAASSLSLDNLTRALAWGLVILTLLFGVGSWLLASAALRPVSAMRRTAERLTGSTSDELLPVGPAHDELFYLASTLNDLIKQLRASADREKQLVSDASHELRTPLAILQTQLELAHLSTGDAAALLGEIESAERTVQRLSALAASLLELTRIEGMTTQETTTFDDLADELADAIDRARLISIGSEIVVDYEVIAPEAAPSGTEPAPVTGVTPTVVASARPLSQAQDRRAGAPSPALQAPEREQAAVGTGRPGAATASPSAVFELSRRSFGRVVDNLLGNAIVAVTESAGSVDTGAAGEGGEGGQWGAGGAGSVRATLARSVGGIRLEIADTGPGMAPEFIPLAFDRFAREDESRGGTRPGSRGAGLGLSIVLALVTSAGGTVTMTNRRPRGLSAVVTLPASSVSHPGHPPPVSGAAPPPDAASPPAPLPPAAVSASGVSLLPPAAASAPGAASPFDAAPAAGITPLPPAAAPATGSAPHPPSQDHTA